MKDKQNSSAFSKVSRWVRAGDPMPKRHRKNLPITFALFAVGIIALICALAPSLGYTNGTIENNSAELFVLALMALIPSLYNIWVYSCCWRRVPGYKWSMVSFFD